MANIITKTTELVKKFWLEYINEDSVAIDATVGNGNDTLFLSERCRKVYGFDIQQEAINVTKQKLVKENTELFCASHDRMAELIKEKADIMVFNLGYLPNGNHDVTTSAETTVEAVSQALNIINKGGLISIVMYWGHEEGKREREAVLSLARALDEKTFHVMYISFPNQANCPPEAILITRKTD